MAKLSAHGTAIGSIVSVYNTKKYMSDGSILINRGQGWKVYGWIKDGIDPVAHYRARAAAHASVLASRPAYAAFRKALVQVPLSKRRRLLVALEMLSSDPDGVWSEACDGYSGNVRLSIDHVVALCRLFEAAKSEKMVDTQPAG